MSGRTPRRILKLVGQQRPHHVKLDLTVDEFATLSALARNRGETREEAIVFMLNAAAELLEQPDDPAIFVGEVDLPTDPA